MKASLIFFVLFILSLCIIFSGVGILLSDKWNKPHYIYDADNIVVTENQYCEIVNYMIVNDIAEPSNLSLYLNRVEMCGNIYVSFHFCAGNDAYFQYGKQYVDIRKANENIKGTEEFLIAIGVMFSVSFFIMWRIES